MSSTGAPAKRIARRIAAAAAQRPQTSWTDRRLVEACLRHDDAAWEALVEKYKNFVFAIVLRYGISREDAGDVFQATWMDVLRDLEQLRDRDNIRSWLAKVTLNKSYHWQKGRRKERERFDPLEDEDPGAEDASPHDWLEELQHEQRIRECVGELTTRCARLIDMLFYEDPPRPYAQVAAQLGLATGSIGFIRRRCLDQLLARLQEEELV